LLLLRLESSVREELSHAKHAVERRADFVTHRREERILRMACCLSGFLGKRQLRRARGDTLFEVFVDPL
jgi:hypothetical protein